MKKDAELGIAKPIRSPVARERVPGSVKRNARVVCSRFRMHFCDLPVDVAGIVVRGSLRDEQRCNKKGRQDCDSIHRDTIAEREVLC